MNDPHSKPGDNVVDNQSHSLPGDGVEKSPGGGTPWIPSGVPTGTPWPSGGPSTGQKPPGWFPIFLSLVTAFVGGPNFDPKSGLDESMLTLFSKMTDNLLVHYHN